VAESPHIDFYLFLFFQSVGTAIRCCSGMHAFILSGLYQLMVIAFLSNPFLALSALSEKPRNRKERSLTCPTCRDALNGDTNDEWVLTDTTNLDPDLQLAQFLAQLS